MSKWVFAFGVFGTGLLLGKYFHAFLNNMMSTQDFVIITIINIVTALCMYDYFRKSL